MSNLIGQSHFQLTRDLHAILYYDATCHMHTHIGQQSAYGAPDRCSYGVWFGGPLRVGPAAYLLQDISQQLESVPLHQVCAGVEAHLQHRRNNLLLCKYANLYSFPPSLLLSFTLSSFPLPPLPFLSLPLPPSPSLASLPPPSSFLYLPHSCLFLPHAAPECKEAFYIDSA